MSQRTLYLRLTSNDGPVEWQLVAADGTCTVGCHALAELPGETQGARIVVMVPATDVTLSKVTLPPVKRSQQRQAALFALEDQLIDDISELHAALGERSKEGVLPLAVVSRMQLDEWLERFAHHHLRPEELTIDLLMLPHSDNEWSVLWEDDGVRIRTGALSGIGFEPELWSLLWPRLLAETGGQRPKRLRVFDARTNSEAALPLDDALPEGEVMVIPHASGMKWLALDENTKHPFNLLQGDYSRREQWGRRLRPWRPAAALFLIWLSIQGGLSLFEMRSLRNQETQLGVQMEELYRKSFPDARKVVDPRLQMEQKLAALKSGDSGFMKLAVNAAPALRNTMVKGMRYQEGVLEIDLSLPNMAALDDLRAALAAKGLQVDIGNATQQDGKVESRLTVRGGGA